MGVRLLDPVCCFPSTLIYVDHPNQNTSSFIRCLWVVVIASLLSSPSSCVAITIGIADIIRMHICFAINGAAVIARHVLVYASHP